MCKKVYIKFIKALAYGKQFILEQALQSFYNILYRSFVKFILCTKAIIHNKCKMKILIF